MSVIDQGNCRTLADRARSAEGLFITFEGIDGSGKSTQLRRIAERLKGDGHNVVVTREPGGSPGAEEIRNLLLNGETDRWSFETEILLFNAARRDHLERTVIPALEDGAVVLCDRFFDTTRAYQGAMSRDRAAIVEEMHRLIIGVEPDLTLLLDISPQTGLRRAMERSGETGETRIEGRGLAFQAEARRNFLALAASESRFRVVDANGHPDPLTDVIKSRIDDLLETCTNRACRSIRAAAQLQQCQSM